MYNASTNTLLSRNEISIIDFSFRDATSNDKNQWTDDVVKQLHAALSTNGAVFLINHGIPLDIFKAANNILKSFCSLPNEIRDKYRKKCYEDIHGYIPPGKEVLYKEQGIDFKYAYNIGNMSGKLPTKEISNFQKVVRDVSKQFISLSEFLLTIIAEALGVDQDRLLGIHKGILEKKDNLSSIRLVYYPPVGEEPVPHITRCGEHTDWGTFSLINEDMEGGLEIFQEGEWRSVGHLPGALLLLVGDVLDTWTSSKYKSPRHRVVIPKDVNDRSKGRSSVIFFLGAHKNTLVHPSVLSPNQSEANGKDSSTQRAENTFTALEYIQNNLKKIKNE